jgi:hypothetical protein
MASLFCPHCGAAMPSERTWAQAAVSTSSQRLRSQTWLPKCAVATAGASSRPANCATPWLIGFNERKSLYG